MLKDAIIIFKKELRNIFRDKRAVFGNYILPLLLFPLIFSVIGTAASRQQQKAVETVYAVEIRNNPDPVFAETLKGHLNFEPRVLNEETEGIIVEFPAGYQPGAKAEVKIYYDSTSRNNSFAAGMVESALAGYERHLSDQYLQSFGISLDSLESIETHKVDIAPPEAQGSEFLVIMIPYLLIIYLFAGSMSIVLDCTAGEKERGSLSLLLVNQVSRSSIALGKILYVITSALINSTSSMIGLILAFTINGDALGGGSMGGASFLSPGVLAGLLLTIVSLSSIAASIMVFLGSFAKNMKEGAGYVMPVYLLALVIGLATMQMDASQNFFLYFIPVVNGIFLLKGILISQFSILALLATLVINGLVALVFVFLTSKLYNSEKILNTV